MKSIVYAAALALGCLGLTSCVVEFYPYLYYPTYSAGYCAPTTYSYRTYHYSRPSHYSYHRVYDPYRCR
jgi:hypothetical protein